MTEINIFSNTRTSISDFALDDHFGYQDVNELKANIDHDWEAFQKAHGADGEHKSWVTANNLLLTVSGADAFIVSGDYTGAFPARRRVKLYCGVDGYKYRTVASAGLSESNTLVNLEADADNALTANLASLELSIVKEIEAMPSWEAVWSKYSDSNILDASGKLMGAELYLDFNPTRALVRAIGEGGLSYRLMGLNSLSDLLAVSGSNVIFYSGFTSTIKTSVSWATIKPYALISLAVGSDLYGIGNSQAIKCSGTTCSFASYSSPYGTYYPLAMIYDGAKLITLAYNYDDDLYRFYYHSGTSLGSLYSYAHVSLLDDQPASAGLIFDNNKDIVVLVNSDSGSDHILKVFTFSGTSYYNLKSSLSFAAPEAFTKFAYDGMRLAAYGNNSIYVYSNIRSSEVVASWSAAGITGLGVEALGGVFENKKSLTPGVPAAALNCPGGRLRLDVSGADGQICRSLELSLAR